jgi:uncharacterized Zn finger protein
MKIVCPACGEKSNLVRTYPGDPSRNEVQCGECGHLFTGNDEIMKAILARED